MGKSRGAVMTTPRLRKELIAAGVDPYEVAALALERAERLEDELREVKSKWQGTFVKRLIADF